MGFLQQFFRADASLVLSIALMVTASFHFLKVRTNAKYDGKIFSSYFQFCQNFDTLLHFVCIITLIAFGYSFGWMEMFKLMVVCLVLPIITHLFALILGAKRWEFLGGLIALPLAICCLLYVFPKLNWFGAL